MKPSDNWSSRSRNIHTAKIQRDNNEEENPLFEQRLNNALDGLESYYYDHLKNRLSRSNAFTIVNYILAMKVETNLSTNYRRETIMSLKLISQFLDNKLFKEVTRDDILSFLESIRKPESKDPTHKWIGTYNHRLIDLLRFFKWLYFPDIESSQRQKPKVHNNFDNPRDCYVDSESHLQRRRINCGG